jgi:hypothetical protein
VVPETKKARDLVVAGPSIRGTSRELGYGRPRARASAVAGRPVVRDPSRLLPIGRGVREIIVALGDTRGAGRLSSVAVDSRVAMRERRGDR